MRGQSLVELALCLPVVVILALGAAAVVRLADARAGLDGATAAAVSTAARQTSPAAADACAAARFAAVVKDYPLQRPVLTTSAGTFGRGTTYSASASATVDLAFVPLGFLPGRVTLTSTAAAEIEPWRSRASQPCA